MQLSIRHTQQNAETSCFRPPCQVVPYTIANKKRMRPAETASAARIDGETTQGWMTSLNAAGVQHAKVIDSVATDSCFATTVLAAAAAATANAASSPTLRFTVSDIVSILYIQLLIADKTYFISLAANFHVYTIQHSTFSH